MFAQSVRIAGCNGHHNLAQRLCRALLAMREASGLSVLSVTQEALAELLAVQRTSITGCAHALHQAGVVRISRGEIRILDVEALLDRACECHVSFGAYGLADTSNTTEQRLPMLAAPALSR